MLFLGLSVARNIGSLVLKPGKVQASQDGLVALHKSVLWDCTRPRSLKLWLCHLETGENMQPAEVAGMSGASRPVILGDRRPGPILPSLFLWDFLFLSVKWGCAAGHGGSLFGISTLNCSLGRGWEWGGVMCWFVCRIPVWYCTILYYVYLVCMHMQLYSHTCAAVHSWRPEDGLRKAVLSFHLSSGTQGLNSGRPASALSTEPSRQPLPDDQIWDFG